MVAAFGCAHPQLRGQMRQLAELSGDRLLGVLAFNDRGLEMQVKGNETKTTTDVVSMRSSACQEQSQNLFKIIKLRKALMVRVVYCDALIVIAVVALKYQV